MKLQDVLVLMKLQYILEPEDNVAKHPDNSTSYSRNFWRYG